MILYKMLSDFLWKSVEVIVKVPSILTSLCNSLCCLQKPCITGTTLKAAVTHSNWPKHVVHRSGKPLNPTPNSCKPFAMCQDPGAKASHTWCSSFAFYWSKTAERQQPGSFAVRYDTKSLLPLAYNGASSQESAAHHYCKMSSEMLSSIHGSAGFSQAPVHEQLFAQISQKQEDAMTKLSWHCQWLSSIMWWHPGLKTGYREKFAALQLCGGNLTSMKGIALNRPTS